MKRLVIYLAVTFALSWGLLIPGGLALGTFANGEASSPLMMVLIALSMFFPLVGALVANHFSRPKERVDLAWKPLVGRNVRSYLIAWFAPAGIALIGCVLFFAMNPQWFDPSMQSYLGIVAEGAGMSVEELTAGMPSLPILMATILVSSLTFAPLVNMIPAFGEELGWRGMLYPTLAERMSPRAAALVTGVIWGVWHAPVIAMGHNYGMGYAGFPIAGILTMTLTCTAMSCWLCLLRQRTSSVWPCALAHGAFNAIANVGVAFSAVGQTVLGPSPLGLVAGIPLLVLGALCLTRLSDK